MLQSNVVLDKFVVMSVHVQGIVWLTEGGSAEDIDRDGAVDARRIGHGRGTARRAPTTAPPDVTGDTGTTSHEQFG